MQRKRWPADFEKKGGAGRKARRTEEAALRSVYKQPAPTSAEGGAGKKRLEKEKRDYERKVDVDRLCCIYFAESAGKIQGKMAAEQAAAKQRGAPKRAQRSLGLGVDL